MHCGNDRAASTMKSNGFLIVIISRAVEFFYGLFL